MDIHERLGRRFPLTTHWEGCEDHHDLCAADREIRRLRVENAGLRKVRERLDWMDSLKSPWRWVMRRRESMDGWALHHSRRVDVERHEKVREAIDAAMRGEGGEETGA